MGGEVTFPALSRFDFSHMNFFGLTDSFATDKPDECPHCEGAWHVGSGLCLRCLLQTGLTEGEDPAGESHDNPLFEIE
jgi:hypothetical protein